MDRQHGSTRRTIIESQNAEGGWRYNPRPFDADISVTVCQMMALRSAKNAGAFAKLAKARKVADNAATCAPAMKAAEHRPRCCCIAVALANEIPRIAWASWREERRIAPHLLRRWPRCDRAWGMNAARTAAQRP